MKAPRRLKRYEVLGLLASGGMADVYLAVSKGIGRFRKAVVLKCIKPEFAANPVFAQMFLEEARLAALLSHPNTVQVYDVDRAGGTAFFAMELLHGHDLREVIARTVAAGERIPLGVAVSVAGAVAAGLHHAHEQVGPAGEALQIVHRDISPHNVFLTFAGEVKVIDFGIAKAADRMNATQTGVVRGKLGYMSPEQGKGQPLDRRSDIFSIGVLLYEMTTQRRAFEGENDFEVLRAVVECQPKPPSELVPAYPPALEKLIARAMDPALDARPQTALELQRELGEVARVLGLELGQGTVEAFMRRVFHGELLAWQQAQTTGVTVAEHLLSTRAAPSGLGGPETMPLRSARRPRRWGLGAGAGVAAGLALGALFWANRGSPPPPIAEPVAAPLLPPAPEPPRPAPAPEPELAVPRPKPPRPPKHAARKEPKPVVDPDAPLPH